MNRLRRVAHNTQLVIVGSVWLCKRVRRDVGVMALLQTAIALPAICLRLFEHWSDRDE